MKGFECLQIVGLTVVLFMGLLVMQGLHTENTTEESASPEVAADTFSGTQVLGDQYVTFTFQPPASMVTFLSQFDLLPPPVGAVVTEELVYLHQLQTDRTETQEAEIVAEVALEDFRLGSSSIGVVMRDKPLTGALLKKHLFRFDYAIFHYKTTFDRIRPSLLDDQLESSIPVPDHPAYPSRHSSQAHFVAFVLGYLDPDQAEVYTADALRIATNREVAGVHYPSDTMAGVALAQGYWEFLLQDEVFRAELEDLQQTEW